MRRRDPFPLADAIARFTERIQPQSLLARVQRAWPEAAGETVAGWATATSERAGVVTVECDDAMIAHELEMMKLELLEKLRTALGDAPAAGALADLKFRVR
jgi:predicted nucleic acid-binding Zn ribbon protein